MNITPYQAKYFAYELTKRSSSDSMQKLASTLVDAQVDLNPHQVSAALFAFRSPLSKGAILADEVGLGKTIEAGLVISQKWAERKRKIIIVTPANLRKQWSQELQDKFFLTSIILEAKSFNDLIKKGNLNPFIQEDIIICSYQFASSKAAYLKAVEWDLAVIDEAHRLRNVYKAGNKIARAIKEALDEAPKILLTATPLQNSLIELYGLVSIIDDYTFGDLKSFKAQYSKINSNENAETFADLKARLKPICHRTLRSQVKEYVYFTNRVALVEEFYPSDEEQKLYDLVTDYLQADNLYALPASQRKLMTLILRRLLASSTFAISSTLEALGKKLNDIIEKNTNNIILEDLADNFETFDELKDEWEEENEEENIKEVREYSFDDIENIKAEIISLKEFETLAKSIHKNSKGEKLFTALDRGFKEMQRLNAPLKAIIFTESTKTQLYLRNILEARGFAEKVVLFNGSNTDQKSKEIYAEWSAKYKNTDKVTGSRSADMRAALVDYFKEEATIMIATEAAAEGINLQFCSMIINYDMPWNPQRIEQRIGRCHRYGQKHDVVVINFLNKANAADVRVYELLRDKFQLFNGVFGASDEVLGSIENGVDFEKRIAEIYQNCRTVAEINLAFDNLKSELKDDIEDEYKKTRTKLLENFDIEVLDKLKLTLYESKEYISKYENWLWNVTKFILNKHAKFNDDILTFNLTKQPNTETVFPVEPFKLGKPSTEPHVYRLGHPLAKFVLDSAKAFETPTTNVVFDLTAYNGNINILEELKGKSGWLKIVSLTVNSFEITDYLLAFGETENGFQLTEDQAKRLITLPIIESKNSTFVVPQGNIKKLEDLNTKELLKNILEKDSSYLKLETEKLTKWADDKINAAELAIKETKAKIKELNRESQKSVEPTIILNIQEQLQELSRKQKKQRQEIFIVEDEIAEMRDKMIGDIHKRMKQQTNITELFTINWKLV
jgi:ERCC4-related helicase